MIHEQERMHHLMRDLLGGELTRFVVVSYDMHEDFEPENTRIACTIRFPDESKVVIEGQGVGPIDAFFNGLLERLSRTYPSLQSLVFEKFTITGKLAPGARKSQSDGLAAVVVGFRNSRGSHFEFEHESRSVTRSGIAATLKGAEYFVNSELAFKKAYEALQDARERKRQDLVAKYTDLMSQLVKNTSYSDFIDQIRSEPEGRS